MQNLQVSRWGVSLLGVFSLIGFIDATYLSAEHFLGLIPPCTLLQGCEQVTTSAYSVILGVPVALLGAIFYLAVMIGVLLYLQTQQEKIIASVVYASWAGLAAAVYFTYIQAFVIHAYCQYCLLSAVTSTLIFIVAQSMVWRGRGSSLDAVVTKVS